MKNKIFILYLMLFGLSLYKNISYPLLWNDESETIMSSTQILKYGYPKVNGEKNIIYMPVTPIKELGYKKEIDANIYMTWGSYYFTALSVLLASLSDNLYTKTALLRIPFATIGFAGIILFLLTLKSFLKREYKIYACIFMTFELLSISLALHLREVRYYSLVIFITACLFYVFSKQKFFNRFTYRQYIFLMTGILFLAFQINFISFAIISLSLLFFEFYILVFKILNNKQVKLSTKIFCFLKEIFPACISLILITPFVYYFEIFKNSQGISDYYRFDFALYVEHLKRIWQIMTKFEFLYLVLLVKIILHVFLLHYLFQRGIDFRKQKFKTFWNIYNYSFFMTFFLIIHVLLIARIPYFTWTRFYIVLQPISILIMIADFFVFKNLIAIIETRKGKEEINFYVYSVCLLVFIWGLINKLPQIQGHIYELTHQYKGPLDYTIPYIQKHFMNAKNLVIATNYEEYSYMYYLDSKVIVGFWGNMEDYSRYKPDFISYRKQWKNSKTVFDGFLKKSSYKKISFPVFDYFVNQIPEFDFYISHQFKSLSFSEEKDMTDLYIKTN